MDKPFCEFVRDCECLVQNIKSVMRRKIIRILKNQYCAEVWEEIFEERNEDAILALCDDRPRGMVPGFDLEQKTSRVATLLATVDTQLHYFRYVIRAWGYGENAETWLVQEGIAKT